MNILLLNHYAGSRQHGMEYRPYYLAREWVRSGHNVTIAAASYSHLRLCAPRLEGEATEERIDGIRFVWLKTPVYNQNGIRRAINILAFLRQVMRHRSLLAADHKPELVIASSTYPLDIVPAYQMARQLGSKLVFEVHDLWPLTLVELGGMSACHPFVLLLQWAENFAYRRADHVVSILPGSWEHMHRHGMSPTKFVHIPNGLDIKEWENERQPLTERHELELATLKNRDQFLVGYAGSLGLANALDTLIQAAEILKATRIRFVLVGRGPEAERLKRRTAEAGLQNVTFLPPVARASVPELLDRMDVLYLGWKKKPIYRFGVAPNKLIDYMMAGKPVIHAVETIHDAVSDSGCGTSISPEDPEALADAILRIEKLPSSEREALGAKGEAYVRTLHDYPLLAKRFLDAVA
jgi:glycosyltransferase involved in cell wall biosynthesis